MKAMYKVPHKLGRPREDQEYAFFEPVKIKRKRKKSRKHFLKSTKIKHKPVKEEKNILPKLVKTKKLSVKKRKSYFA